MTFSEFICENTNLWLEWNKLYAIGQNKDFEMPDRARAYKESERIVDLINNNISLFDDFLINSL